MDREILSNYAFAIQVFAAANALHLGIRPGIFKARNPKGKVFMDAQLEPADIFLSRTRGIGSWLIRFFTRTSGESESQVSHVGIVVEGGPLEKAIIVESRGRTRRRLFFRRYGKKRKYDVAIFRPLRLTPVKRAMIVQAALDYVGKEYSYFKILLHLLDWVLQGAYVFRRLGGINDYPICSWLVAHAFAKAGEIFGKPPDAADPDDIWDFIQTHPQKYRMLWPLSPLMPPKH
jgi:hypothetical protein